MREPAMKFGGRPPAHFVPHRKLLPPRMLVPIARDPSVTQVRVEDNVVRCSGLHTGNLWSLLVE
jgi:hypothetical protein